MRALEFTLILLFIISIMMGYAAMPGGNWVLVMAAILLSMFYFFAGTGFLRSSFIHRLRNSPHGEHPGIIIRAFAGMTFALCITGVMFNELLWRGHVIYVYAGILALTLLMFISLLYLENREPATNRYIIFRSILFSCALLFFVVVPLHKRLEWKYEDQYYREILQYSLENPDDDEARKTVIDYERRVNGLAPLEDTVLP